MSRRIEGELTEEEHQAFRHSASVLQNTHAEFSSVEFVQEATKDERTRMGHAVRRRNTMKALIMSSDTFEDMELMVPYYRLKEAGLDVHIASSKKGTIKGIHDYTVTVDKTLDEINPDDYAILVIPGGKAPQKIRDEEKAKELARNFFEHDKPVAAICHGPQVLISAGLMRGRHATSYASVADELKKAGAIYEDKEVVVDGNLITSRGPSDLPAFMRESIKKIDG